MKNDVEGGGENVLPFVRLGTGRTSRGSVIQNIPIRTRESDAVRVAVTKRFTEVVGGGMMPAREMAREDRFSDGTMRSIE